MNDRPLIPNRQGTCSFSASSSAIPFFAGLGVILWVAPLFAQSNTSQFNTVISPIPGLIIRPNVQTTIPVQQPMGANRAFATTVITPIGAIRNNFFDRNSTFVGFTDTAPFQGSAEGWRTRTTTHFDEEGNVEGYSQVSLQRTGYGMTRHFSPTGELTGWTITDWLGRHTDFDAQGRVTGQTNEISSLATQKAEHPFIPNNDSVNSVPYPQDESVMSSSVDLGLNDNTWLGISVATLFPSGFARAAHYDTVGQRSGATRVLASVTVPPNDRKDKAYHYDSNIRPVGWSRSYSSEGGYRRTRGFDMRSTPVSFGVSNPYGLSYVYDPQGKLIGGSR